MILGVIIDDIPWIIAQIPLHMMTSNQDSKTKANQIAARWLHEPVCVCHPIELEDRKAGRNITNLQICRLVRMNNEEEKGGPLADSQLSQLQIKFCVRPRSTVGSRTFWSRVEY
jgi:hypothetical protein